LGGVDADAVTRDDFDDHGEDDQSEYVICGRSAEDDTCPRRSERADLQTGVR